MPLIMPSPRTGKIPQIHKSAFIAPTAVIIGDVTIGEGSNIWFGAVLRGDWGPIIIGKNTSIQENVTIHNMVGSTVDIGDNCIIGHHAMIHGPCTIENGCLVGIGANAIHRSKLGEGAILAAGAVVYLRARQRWLRLAALLGSVMLVVLLTKPIVNTYWSTHTWG